MVDQQNTRMCTGCGRQIPTEYNVCPHCGRPQNQPQYGQPQQQYGQPYAPPQETLGGLKYLLYIVSFLIPIVGFIIGIIWLGAGTDSEKKHVGKNCLILALVGVVLGILCAVLFWGSLALWGWGL